MLLASIPDRTGVDQDRRADPRSAASITLLGVVLAAALQFAPYRPPAANLPQAAAAEGTAAAPRSVKIVGASPRGESCADQVWPYIEPRCLTRAPTGGPAAPDIAKVSPDATRTAATAEPAAPAAAPVSHDQPIHQRVATTYLPVRRAARAETTGLAAPPGAVPPRHFESDAGAAPREDDGWNERDAEATRESRRHGGRRSNRARHYQRSFFGIPF